MNRIVVPTYTASIYVAGPQVEAERICREFVMRGLCVTVEPVEFIYTGGQERGVRVGLINYPRFPAEPADIIATAEELARTLVGGMHQHSASIVATDRTIWISARQSTGADAGEVAPFTRCRQRPNVWACSPVARTTGSEAARRARQLASAGARCTITDTDRYGRNVAVCTVNGQDLGGQLVREGLAISETNYGDPYRREEDAARRERKGIWR